MTRQARLRGLLEEAGSGGGRETLERLDGYLDLLEKWNARVNLTASTAWEALEPLLWEAVWAARLYPAEARAHLDIGSGAGFPAVVLKLLLPGIELDLVDSREKKVLFLETVARTLGLPGMRAHHARLADFLSGTARQWDCVSWKALKLGRGDLQSLCRHAHGGTRLWMFHGREPALQDARTADGLLELVRRERIPGRREAQLSIYRCFT